MFLKLTHYILWFLYFLYSTMDDYLESGSSKNIPVEINSILNKVIEENEKIKEENKEICRVMEENKEMFRRNKTEIYIIKHQMQILNSNLSTSKSFL